MTCPNCGFENMKNQTVCFRCGGKLVWDGPTGARHFQPPRAGRIGRSRRSFERFMRMFAAGGAFLGGIRAVGRVFGVWRRISRTNLAALFLSIVPGAGQIYLGKYLLGPMFLLVSSALLMRILQAGPFTTIHLLLTILITVHMLAALLALEPRKVCKSFLESLALWLPVILVLTVIYNSITFVPRGRSFQIISNGLGEGGITRGDVLSLRADWQPKPGQLVLIDTESLGRVVPIAPQGGWVGRVYAIWLGGAATSLAIDGDGRVTINQRRLKPRLEESLRNNFRRFELFAGSDRFLAIPCAPLPEVSDEVLRECLEYPDYAVMGVLEARNGHRQGIHAIAPIGIYLEDDGQGND